jgi:disulfide bond formation protein DsbB
VVETVETLTSVLALVAGAGAVLVIVARLLAGRSRLAADLGARAVALRTPLTLVVAATAMLGSLYFSEVEHFLPCRWCWFQRVAMYPIALVALIALGRRDGGARWYMAPLAAIGAAISTYHYLIEWGVLDDSESCALFGPSCADIWFRELGFVTLAFMALCGFAFIVVINTISFDRTESRSSQESP